MAYLLSYKQNNKWIKYDANNDATLLENNFLAKNIYHESYIIEEVYKYVNNSHCSNFIHVMETKDGDYFKHNGKIVYSLDRNDLNGIYEDRILRASLVNFDDFIEVSSVDLRYCFPTIDNINYDNSNVDEVDYYKHIDLNQNKQ